MAKEIHWIPEEDIREVCRKMENGEIDFGPSEAVKEEIEKKGITIKIIKQEHMEEQKKARRGRPVTPYKIPLMVRISQEAAEIMKQQTNQSEFIDNLIKNSKR